MKYLIKYIKQKIQYTDATLTNNETNLKVQELYLMRRLSFRVLFW